MIHPRICSAATGGVRPLLIETLLVLLLVNAIVRFVVAAALTAGAWYARKRWLG